MLELILSVRFLGIADQSFALPPSAAGFADQLHQYLIPDSPQPKAARRLHVRLVFYPKVGDCISPVRGTFKDRRFLSMKDAVEAEADLYGPGESVLSDPNHNCEGLLINKALRKNLKLPVLVTDPIGPVKIMRRRRRVRKRRRKAEHYSPMISVGLFIKPLTVHLRRCLADVEKCADDLLRLSRCFRLSPTQQKQACVTVSTKCYQHCLLKAAPKSHDQNNTSERTKHLVAAVAWIQGQATKELTSLLA